MIINDRQHKISVEQAALIKEAMKALEKLASDKAKIDPRIALAQKQALESQHESLCAEIAEYEKLKASKEKLSEITELADLPKILIKARISQGLSQTELARQLNMKPQQIQRYEAEEYSSANISRLLEIAKVLGISLKKNAQVALSKDENENFWDKFPINEMYKRGWFLGYDGPLNKIKVNAEEFLTDFFSPIGESCLLPALHKKKARTGSQIDEYALSAWQARVVQLALMDPCKASFQLQKVNDAWIKELLSLSVNEDGPKFVKEHLGNVGINFVIEPHLTGTHLDGAAIRQDGQSPIVALTLRYDRLDNFWFVLLHEVAHVVKHLGSQENMNFLDDLDIEATDDPREKEANDFAYEKLMPPDEWETSFARFMATPQVVTEQARAWGIHPAIIAGRIRKEQENYRILNELVGNGEVRKLFPEITSWT